MAGICLCQYLESEHVTTTDHCSMVYPNKVHHLALIVHILIIENKQMYMENLKHLDGVTG